jgi:hypothetical protein
MGDRGCIVVKSENQPDLVFYTHWSASALPTLVQNALLKVEEAGRSNDFDYFNRIIFTTLINGDDSGIGYGIGFTVAGDAWRIVELNFDSKEVRISDDGGGTYASPMLWHDYAHAKGLSDTFG